MNKFKIGILTLVIICISCNKKSEIESQFITNKNEYWGYRDYCWNTKGIYFQFNKNGNSTKYLLNIEDGFYLFDKNGTMGSEPVIWFIKADSTFVFDNSEYKIEKISKEEILLSYYHYQIKDKKCFVKLSKWIDGPNGPKPLSPNVKIEK